MRFLLRLVKIAGLLVAVVVLSLVAVLAVSFSGYMAIKDGQRLGGVEVVKDGFVSSFIVDVDADGKSVILVDAGNDREAKPILLALARRNLSPAAVKAILLTHGDRDHTAGVHAFPKVEVMVLEPDVGLAEGREARGVFKLMGSPHPNGIKVARALHDGETLHFGGVDVRVFAVPGHTKGSAAFLARNVLFMGDSAEATKSAGLAPAKRLTTDSPAQNRESLRALAARLAPMAGEVQAIAPAHSGVLTAGLTPLTTLAASTK
jgi:glyoxylase-like metal-dependent hydrolase (beta-lactamase superfamily II)